MPASPITLYVDVDNHKLVQGTASAIATRLPCLYQGDTLSLVLRFMTPTGVTSSPYQDVDYSGASVIVAIGNGNQQPVTGTFTVTDSAATQVTAAIAYNALASDVQAAIQAALTTNWSTATVYGPQGGPWTITNGVNGSKPMLLGTSLNLYPLSSASFNEVQAGTESEPEIQMLTLEQSPVTLQDTWTANTDPISLSGTLPLNTAGIENILQEQPSVELTFAIKVTPAGGQTFTAYQGPVVINNDLILGAPSAPTPGVEYYTTSQSDVRYLSKLYLLRNSSGSTSQHITTSSANGSNVLYLMSNCPSSCAMTFDNATVDGQMVILRMALATDLTPITLTFSFNVSGMTSSAPYYGAGVSLYFVWDNENSVWFPL